MGKLLLFAILSLPVVYISLRTLFKIKSHGFYRFFCWECVIWLFISNCKFWFDDPLSVKQILSWTFLFISVYLVISGVVLLKRKGKQISQRDEKELFQFEKMSQLIDQGIFRFIRHPLYSSLLFLTWGIFLKNISLSSLLVTLSSSVFVYFTAVFDEKECIRYFGNQYIEYIGRTKRFIPFII